MKGFKTIFLSLLLVVTGGLTAGGFMTPDMNTEVTAAAQDAISSLETMVGAFEVLFGIGFAALRAVTSTKIFSSQ